jgi:WD40 repeat protein
LYEFNEVTEDIQSVDWHPDGTRLASGSSSSICVWEVDTRKVALRIPSPEASVNCVRWSEDRKRLAAGFGRDWMRIYDATAGFEQAARD